jgi:hypothetical protein
LMAGTREAKLAKMNPVTRKHAAAPILALRTCPSEVSMYIALHSKRFRA